MNLKEQILAAAQSQANDVEKVTAWGIDCFIKIMSGTERDQWESQILDDGKIIKDQFRAKLLVKVLADAEGKRLFTDQDTPTLSSFDSVELDRLYSIAAKANGLSKGDVDELTKNS